MGTHHHPDGKPLGLVQGGRSEATEDRSFARPATLRAILEDTADFLRHLRVSEDQKVAVDSQVAAIEQVLTSGSVSPQ